MSVLLRQAGCFEGFGEVRVGSDKDNLALPQFEGADIPGTEGRSAAFTATRCMQGSEDPVTRLDESLRTKPEIRECFRCRLEPLPKTVRAR